MADTGYSVGNLEIKINAMSDNATKSLSNVIERIQKLSVVLKTITVDDVKWVSSLNTRLSTLSKNMSKMDWTALGKGFDKLTIAITPFVDKINSANEGLKNLAIIMSRTSGKSLSTLQRRLDISDNSIIPTKKTKNFGMTFGKLSFAVYLTRRLAKATSDIVNAGSNYTETLNMWQVAMRNNLDVADEFVKKMNKAYGVSTETLMRTQAIFKNMIGSLGQISDQVAYQISESFTQMALDFSSLYNVSFESAIKKFQAVLAGQVRPIRSVSGYDITETTLFELYKGLGGEKSMRQLNRTEKQLLSILAVFKQMEASGAVGDLSKTLGSFANQSRMVSENWKEFITWVGIGLKMLIEQSGLLKFINAMLIVGAEVVKSIVYSMGYEVPDFLKDIFETTKGENNALEDTNKELDKIKGKLLGFDKFRALQGQEDSNLPIDEVLLKALEDYKSVLANASNEARNFAENILKALGYVDENKDGVYEMTESAKLLNGILISIATSLGIIASLKLGALVIKPLHSLGVYLMGLASPIGSATTGFLTMNTALTTTKTGVLTMNKALLATNILMGAIAGILGFLVVDAWLSDFGEDARKIAAPIMVAVGALVALASALVAVKGAISWGVGIPMIMAGIGAGIAGIKAMVGLYADGGVPDKGSLFIAGESGAELVGNMGNGNTGVMNMEQMENAVARGMIKALARQTKQGETIQINIDGKQVFNVVKENAKRQGLGFSRV